MKKTPASGTALAGLALFTSLGTLVCCALPAALVAVGAGAVMAGLVTALPGLVTLSEHKDMVFTVAGMALAAAAVVRHMSRNAPCPVEPAQAAACTRLRRRGGQILALSAAVYAVGFFFAYVMVFLE
ncbi:MAG: hypothetical protein K1X51_11650 [Rhodospirillaceae bacterium]|nr:hypothetical protein [Rhodospirillaceae bacterium]